MNTIKTWVAGFSILALSASLNAALNASASGRVNFGKLPSSSAGKPFVEVHIKSNLVSMVARLAEKAEPEVAEALRGLRQVDVNVIGLGEDNRAAVDTRLQAIRTDLESQGWDCLVKVREARNDVAVYVKTNGDEALLGLAVLVVEENQQAVLANLVGDIRPEKISLVAEKFGIDPLKKIGEELKKQSR